MRIVTYGMVDEITTGPGKGTKENELPVSRLEEDELDPLDMVDGPELTGPVLCAVEFGEESAGEGVVDSVVVDEAGEVIVVKAVLTTTTTEVTSSELKADLNGPLF